VSVLNHDGATLAADLSGVTVNLLNQEAKLSFDAIEGTSTYCIAPIRYTDGDVLRFRIGVALPDHPPLRLEFQPDVRRAGAMNVVLATTNAGKLAELNVLLLPLGVACKRSRRGCCRRRRNGRDLHRKR
jgi:hypothetical protein